MGLRYYDPTLGKTLFEGEQAKPWKALLSAIQEEFEDMQRGLSSAESILLTLPAARSGLAGDILVSLQEYLEPLLNDALGGAVPSGMVMGYDGTLANARLLDGWAVCDGESGTSNMLGRYPKWSASGSDAGGTGGNLTHTHDDHTGAQVVALVDTHDAHDHAFSATTGAGSCSVCVDDGCQCCSVSLYDHTHSVSGTTCQQDEAGSMDHTTGGAGGSGDPLSHSNSNNEPPYTELIPIMKL